MMALSLPQIDAVSERTLLLRFGDCIDTAINAQVHAAAALLAEPAMAGIDGIVPAYASLAVHYDLRHWTVVDPTRTALQSLSDALLQRLATASPAHVLAQSRRIEVPVCHDAAFAPDLTEIAERSGLNASDVIERHCAPLYRVAMLGFAPGFPYLLGLDSALHVPRRSQPRLQVAAGSVAIGGAQTGIYPSALPGGWHLIGRTPWRLFAADRDPPNRLAAGDFVRFVAIDRDAFEALLEHAS